VQAEDLKPGTKKDVYLYSTSYVFPPASANPSTILPSTLGPLLARNFVP